MSHFYCVFVKYRGCNLQCNLIGKYPHLFIFFIICIIILTGCKDQITPPVAEDNVYGEVTAEMAFIVLKPDKSVWAWGMNTTGILGDGTVESKTYPVRTKLPGNIISIDQSHGTAVAADSDGNIWYWGSAIYTASLGITEPVIISNLRGVKSIKLGIDTVYMLMKNGSIWSIKIDHLSPAASSGPTRIDGVSDIVSISKDMAVTKEGRVFDLVERKFIHSNLKDIVQVSGMYNRHRLVLRKDGIVYALGNNDYGQLGNGTFEKPDVPVQVKNLSEVTSVSANFDYNLALKKDGTVWHWGYEGRKDSIPPGQNLPLQIKEITEAVLIYAGYESIIMTKDGSYWIYSAKERTAKKITLE